MAHYEGFNMDLIQQVLQLWDKGVLSKRQLESLISINLETAEVNHKEWERCSNVEKNCVLMQLFDKQLITEEALLKQTFGLELDQTRCDRAQEYYSYHNLKVKRIEKEAKTPTRKHPTDAGMDVYALEEVVIPAHTIQIVKTGVTVDFPDGTVALVWPKSRSDFLVGAGVIDCGYQGEILVKVSNISSQELKIERHQGLAQIVIVPVVCPSIEEVDEIHQKESDRGATGGIAGNAGE